MTVSHTSEGILGSARLLVCIALGSPLLSCGAPVADDSASLEVRPVTESIFGELPAARIPRWVSTAMT